MNYFELFNLSTDFQIDLTGLSQTYQTLQKLTHPDKFATGSGREKLLAVQKNAQVNDAYQTLKSPLLRAEYLLELRGIELKHEHQTMQDPTFLMQQMEWREQLEMIDPNADPLNALETLDKEIQQHYQSQLQLLQTMLNDDNEQANLSAANEVRKLKFLHKLRNEIAVKEDLLSEV
jgi:molecular chaperone HscB